MKIKQKIFIRYAIIACVLCMTLTACYFNNIPVYPGTAAFHNADTSPFFLNGNQRISGMATDGELVVAVSELGSIAWSEDHGINWQTANSIVNPLPGGIRFNAVAYGEGYFLAGGDAGKAAWSQDGKVWHMGVIGPMNPKNIRAVAAGELKRQRVFVAGGTDGRIAYAVGSPQGPWFQVSFSPFGELEDHGESINALAYGKIKGAGIFVAAGDNGQMAILRDFSGNLYGPTGAGTQYTFRGLCFGNDRFVAVGDGALMKISGNPESYTWTTIRDSGFGMRPFLNIAFDPGMEYFVLIAADSVTGFSQTGESWSAITLSSRFIQGISAVVCTKRRIILGGEDGMIVYSN